MKSIITLVISIFLFSQIAIGQLSTPIENPEPAIIEFVETEASFGKIQEGEIASHVFIFKNTSDVPLLILSAKGSCGCTIPFFPKDPIMPGEMSEIEVEFNSKGKKGKRNQRVIVTANTYPKQTFLYLKGEIEYKDVTKLEETEIALDKEAIVKEKLQSVKPSCISIFPNPANEFVQLELKEYIGKSANVTIFNQMGQEVMKSKVDKISRESTRLDVNNLLPGTYVISIAIDNSEVVTQCFMVARS